MTLSLSTPNSLKLLHNIATFGGHGLHRRNAAKEDDAGIGADLAIGKRATGGFAEQAVKHRVRLPVPPDTRYG